MPGAVPTMPGVRAPHEMAQQYRREVARLIGRGENPSFPGAQPVSFARRHLEELKKEDYYVCEKSDGIRCLMYFAEGDRGQEIHYLIDRRNDYYYVPELHFPAPNDPTFQKFHIDTLIDGELVLDEEPHGNVLRYLVFDCLVLDGNPLMHRTLDKRLAYFREYVYNPYVKLCDAFPQEVPYFPFLIEFKPMEFSYAIGKMFNDVLPNLKHGNDGLIFTCRNSAYKFGTDEKILKWKPASENSIDFRLNLHFPIYEPDSSDEDPDDDEDHEPCYDWDAMPEFALSVFEGGRQYIPFATMYMTEKEWEDMKALQIPLDDRIVECAMDEEKRWRFLRFREDKKDGNHISVVGSVLESIRDGVGEKDLLREAMEIRAAWKRRMLEVPPAVVRQAPPQGQQQARH
ncbi:mRNA capping enzyme, alpha subunit [Terfezia boudieri ATCC MYA-4762]|uniref:mRNA-capping enzyme subunit alpha n=1 Tax=Terfezia boudieri ATCC MYA-4762 TaxID=1051890 RepID=A0A3N4L9S4_9PEZI|nr:mRNA capping enzyme, alpha subunit [Terfezia boudieri ATCC MYA-4762]